MVASSAGHINGGYPAEQAVGLCSPAVGLTL
jgi:hypothetical protein